MCKRETLKALHYETQYTSYAYHTRLVYTRDTYVSVFSEVVALYLCPALKSCTVEGENLLAPYWLPGAVSNGFDTDNTVVFVKGGGDVINKGTPSWKKKEEKKWKKKRELKWRRLKICGLSGATRIALGNLLDSNSPPPCQSLTAGWDPSRIWTRHWKAETKTHQAYTHLMSCKLYKCFTIRLAQAQTKTLSGAWIELYLNEILSFFFCFNCKSEEAIHLFNSVDWKVDVCGGVVRGAGRRV